MLVKVKTGESPSALVKIVNDNFSELDLNKASIDQLSNFIPVSQKGAANGVASLNATSRVAQKAESAVVADEYSKAAGGSASIESAIAGATTDISNIKSGVTPVGKALVFEPAVPAPNDTYYGKSAGGAYGFFPMPSPGGDVQPIISEPFTSTDSRWDAGSIINGVTMYTLTMPHGGKYAVGVYKQDGANYIRVFVDDLRNATNILVRAEAKFTGYILMG